LLLGILLARNHGIKVTIVDADIKVNDNPRAAHYAPSAMFDFKRAGIIDDVRKRGFTPAGVCWRLQDTTFLAGMGRQPDTSEYAMSVLPLDQLCPLLVEHFLSCPNTEIKWAHKVVGVEQDDKGATAIVETSEGPKKLTGDFLVGADGASSGVRTALFGKEYPGETLSKQIVATNVCLFLKLALIALIGLPRCISPSMSDSTTGIRTSSFTPRTGTWPRRLRQMDCGVSPMAMMLAFRVKRSLSASQCDTRRFFLATPSQVTTSWSA
jgi:2-polyprenyl-6-methoxyphenol hydroxylase-like FAD-dependent oxidoreductase